MPRTKDSTSIELPTVLRDRLLRLKVHERQAFHEVVEEALDLYEDVLHESKPRAQVLSGAAESTPS